MHILAPCLAPLARLNVPRDIFVHVGPKIRLQQSLFCFGDALVAGQQSAVRFVDEVVDLGRWDHQHCAGRRVVAAQAAPQNAVLQKARGGHSLDVGGLLFVGWQLFMLQKYNKSTGELVAVL